VESPRERGGKRRGKEEKKSLFGVILFRPAHPANSPSERSKKRERRRGGEAIHAPEERRRHRLLRRSFKNEGRGTVRKRGRAPRRCRRVHRFPVLAPGHGPSHKEGRGGKSLKGKKKKKKKNARKNIPARNPVAAAHSNPFDNGRARRGRGEKKNREKRGGRKKPGVPKYWE